MWCNFVFAFFCFDFVLSHARCDCCSIVCLCFQDVQIKQTDCKISTKMWIIINKKHFVIFLDNCTHKNIKPRKSRKWGFSATLTPTHFFTVRGRQKRDFGFFKITLGTRSASAKWNEVNRKPDEINELILKTKTYLKERPDNI